MEIAYWLKNLTKQIPEDACRIYLGSESQMEQMPSLPDITEFYDLTYVSNRQITLITPAFLTEQNLKKIYNLIETLYKSISNFEVVCND